MEAPAAGGIVMDGAEEEDEDEMEQLEALYRQQVALMVSLCE